MDKKVLKWNTRYQQYAEPVAPCQVLEDYAYLLPASGIALDLACGFAANAFFMAARGLHVDALDISPVAIAAVNQRAQQLPVTGIVRDIEAKGLLQKQYQVIVVSYFLNRALIPEILACLAPSGLLFYQTWTREKVSAQGPGNPEYLLCRGELLVFCQEMQVLHYHEEGAVGDISKGLRNQACIIARKV